jgi:MoaA/NifB/PqqE/SkfB family radical SAM enzyme
MYFKRKALTGLYKVYEKLSYMVSFGGFSLLPSVIIINMTSKCNLRCKMCPYYGPKGINPDVSREFDFLQFKKMILDIKKTYRVYPFKPVLGFLGGEAFLKKDFIKYLRFVSQQGFKFGVTTNFSACTKKQISEILKLKPLDIRVSLDGLEEVHDEIRNVKGLFKTVIDNIKYLRTIKSYDEQKVRLNCVLLEDNVDSMFGMIELAEKLDCDIQFQHLVFSDEQHEKEHKDKTKDLFGEDLTRFKGGQDIMVKDTNKLKENIKKINELTGKKIKINFLPDLSEEEIEPYYYDLDNYTHSKRCYFPWGTARIDCEGNVYPCMKLNYGNLLEERFGVVWNNKKARKFRKNLAKSKLFPNCIRCCKI